MSKLQFATTAGTLIFHAQNAMGGRVLVPCQLFKAGVYADKGVTITESDLDALMLRFNTGDRQVPIRVEHIESPLDPLGHVVAVHREGDLLFGTLAFPSGLYSHIQERKADKVSVGLHVVEDEHGKGYLLHECSLVFVPRVQGAGFLSPEMIAAKLTQFRALGKLTPAMELPLSRLLAPVSLNFSDGLPNDFNANLDAFFEAMPVVLPRGGVVPGLAFGAPTQGGSALDPTMTKWAKDLGLDPVRVAKIKEGKA